MKFIIITIFSFSCVLHSFSQSNGYFGKSNIVEFNTTLTSPMFYNFSLGMNDEIKLKASGNSLEPAKNLINYGFRLSVGRTLGKTVGLHLEGAIDYFKVTSINKYGYNDLETEMFSIQKKSFMPKIEFTTTGGGLPLGLSHQVGLGLNTYSLMDKNYLVRYTEYNDSTNSSQLTTFDNTKIYSSDEPTITGYTFMYKLNMRIPITKSLLVNIGFRYTFNFVPVKDEYSTSAPLNSYGSYNYNDNKSEYFMDASDLHSMIKYRENKSILAFETGLCYTF
jgi:hypothetical protein